MLVGVHQNYISEKNVLDLKTISGFLEDVLKAVYFQKKTLFITLKLCMKIVVKVARSEFQNTCEFVKLIDRTAKQISKCFVRLQENYY